MTLDLPDFKIEVYFGRWEFAARYHLTASDAETMTIGELLALGGDGQLDDLRLGYTPTWGTQPLREAIAGTYDDIDADEVLVFAGAEEALFWAMLDSIGPGEHAILTVPNYQSMETVALSTGAEVSALQLRPEENWALDLDRLQSLIRPDTRLIAVNFPNNPTGGMAEADDFRELAALCDEAGIRLFSDEVHRGLELDPAATLPQAADLSRTAVSLGVMSKAYGLPGLRIGWLASHDPDLLRRLERRKHYTTICNAAPSEYLATIALRCRDRILERNRSILRKNLPLFDGFFAAWPDLFEWQHPAGGCVCFPRYLGVEGPSALCRELVERTGVLLLGPEIFASTLAQVPNDRFRIGLARRDPGPALDAFDKFLRGRAR